MKRRLVAVAIALACVVATTPAFARHQKQKQTNAQVTQFCGDRYCSSNVTVAREAKTSHRHVRGKHRVVQDANGNSVVRSSGGVAVRVAPSARAALQCVVNYVEAAGVRIKFMRGYGPGTVRASLHPSGRAIDINQTARNITRPVVPRSISNAAADRCGVISGARWGYADNGHWNLAVHGRVTQEPWPRVVTNTE